MKKRWPWQPQTLIGSILVLTFLLRLTPSGTETIVGYDDHYSLYLANLAAHRDWTAAFVDFHMIVYNLLLTGWVKIWGTTIAAGKALSLGFTLIGFLFVFLLAKHIFNLRVAFFSMAILTTSPAVMFYSTQIRAYALTMAAAVATTYFFVRFREDRSCRTRILFLGSATICAYGHFSGIMFLVGLFLSDTFFAREPTLNRSKKLGESLKLFLPVFLFYLPITYLSITNLSPSIQSIYSWVPKPNIMHVLRGFAHVSGSWGAFAMIALIVPSALFFKKLYTQLIGQLVTLVLFPFVTLLLISYLYQPVFIPRGLIGAVPFLAILTAAAIVSLVPRQAIQVALVGGIVLANAIPQRRDLFLKLDYNQLIQKFQEQGRNEQARPTFYHDWYNRYAIAYYFVRECFNDRRIGECLEDHAFYQNHPNVYSQMLLSAPAINFLDLRCRRDSQDLRQSREFRSKYVSQGRLDLGPCFSLESFTRLSNGA